MKNGARKIPTVREQCEASLTATRRRAKVLGHGPAIEANAATFAAFLLETFGTPERARDACPDGEAHRLTREYLARIEDEEKHQGIPGGLDS